MSQAIIRDMDDADRETVIDLIWELNRFENGVSGDRAPDRKAAASGLGANRRRMAGHGGIELVAEVDGAVVGYLLCVIESAQAYVHSRYSRHAYIAELVVAQAMRGKGLGQRLMAAAEAFAREQGVPSIFIGVLAGNEPADRLYDHLGYRRYSIERMKRLEE